MYISVDIGGTRTRVASSKDLENIYKIEKFDSSDSLDTERKMVHEAIARVSDGEDVEFVCIGVPGQVKRYDRQVTHIKYYPEIDHMSFEEFFGAGSESNLVIDNDSSLAGLAESIRGKGKDYRSVAYITLSTGVGGTMVLDKKLLELPWNTEPGWQIILKGGRTLGWDIEGRLGAYASGSSLKKFEKVDPKICEDQKIWDEFGEYLGTGLVNLVSMWSPEIVILGGGVSNKFDYFKDSMMKELEKQYPYELPKVVKSDLGDDNGVLGGFDFIKQKLEK